VKREIGIEQIKDLQADANLPPYEGKRKVFIIDKAELLSLEAANSLLKILEEPPPQVTFILLSSKEWLLLPTVISRCQRLGLKPLPLNSFKEILEETRQERSSRSLLQEEVELLARLSHGCLGWALLTLEDKQILAERSQRLEAHISLCQANRLKRLAYADELASLFSQNWEKIIEILRLWLDWWHDLVLIKSGVEKFIINIDHQTELQKLARIYQLAEMKQFIIRIQEATKQLEQNANPRLVFEVLLLNMPFGKPSLVGADS
jgi:DNA polymerase-3 subunit delta'